MPNGIDPPGEDPYAPIRRTLRLAQPLQRLLMRAPHRAVAARLREQGAREVLDLCCGSGTLSHRLARDGWTVLGVDRSPTMLELAGRGGGAFRTLDAADLPFAAEFDAAVISLALHEMDPALRPRVWAGMRRAVRPGGLLLAIDFDHPRDGRWLGRAVGRYLASDERSMGKVHPPHYANYREFMARGGLSGWLRDQDAAVLAGQGFWAGNLALVAVRND